MKNIYVYQDYVHNNAVLLRRLADVYGCGRVRICDTRDILNGVLDTTAGCLVMPGGADLYFCEKLAGAGNDAIRRFVENGGAYLGICAGAYYACRSVEWHPENAASITGARSLGFYPGKAVGPINGYLDATDADGIGDGLARLKRGSTVLNVLYRSGPYFTPEDNQNVLATYDNLPHKPAAIVESKVGKGRAILCGPHIEFTGQDYERILYRHKNPHFAEDKNRIADLKKYNQEIKNLWRDILNRLVPEPR